MWGEMLLDQFDAILFDVDETLFNFDSLSGLKRLFANYHVLFTEQDFIEYQSVNKPLWNAYQNSEIDASYLQVARFQAWAEKLNCSAIELNQGFLAAMGEICQPLPGAERLLQALAGRVELGVITNGFNDLLDSRLTKTGFKHYFDVITVSENFGVAKPDPAIFRHTLEQLTHRDPQRVLMVGDTPESDILGGMNAEMQTCWLDHGERTLAAHIQPNFHVKNLAELEKLLTTSR